MSQELIERIEDCIKRVDELQAELATAREDSARLDWLEGEPVREQDWANCRRRDLPYSLFRRNQSITREAIDAARKAEGR